jgi:hypothetical protein
MAFTVTNVLSATGPNYGSQSFICTVISTADADTVVTMPHGLLSTPLLYGFTQVLSQALAASSGWALAVPGAVNLVGTKLATVGSGNAGIQVMFWAMTPTSLIR